MNNYLQVDLGGKKRGLKFNLGTFFMAKDALNVDITTAINKDHKELAIIVYSALMSNCRSKKEEPDFNMEDVVDWVLELESIDQLNQISQMFSDITKSDASREGGEDTQQAA